MRAFRTTVIAVAAVASAGLSAAASTAADSPATRVIDGIEVTVPGVDTSAGLEAFLRSSEPKTSSSTPRATSRPSPPGGRMRATHAPSSTACAG